MHAPAFLTQVVLGVTGESLKPHKYPLLSVARISWSLNTSLGNWKFLDFCWVTVGDMVLTSKFSIFIVSFGAQLNSNIFVALRKHIINIKVIRK